MVFLPFRDVLQRHLDARGLSLRAFAREVGVPVSLLSKLKAGTRSAPMHRLESWATHLRLVGRERTEFIDSAMWTTVPKRLKPWLEQQLSAKPKARH